MGVHCAPPSTAARRLCEHLSCSVSWPLPFSQSCLRTLCVLIRCAPQPMACTECPYNAYPIDTVLCHHLGSTTRTHWYHLTIATSAHLFVRHTLPATVLEQSRTSPRCVVHQNHVSALPSPPSQHAHSLTHTYTHTHTHTQPTSRCCMIDRDLACTARLCKRSAFVHAQT